MRYSVNGWYGFKRVRIELETPRVYFSAFHTEIWALNSSGQFGQENIAMVFFNNYEKTFLSHENETSGPRASDEKGPLKP